MLRRFRPRQEDEPSDWDRSAWSTTGTIQQLVDFARARKVPPKNPIGFHIPSKPAPEKAKRRRPGLGRKV